jgi:hypothetical protein
MVAVTTDHLNGENVHTTYKEGDLRLNDILFSRGFDEKFSNGDGKCF